MNTEVGLNQKQRQQQKPSNYPTQETLNVSEATSITLAPDMPEIWLLRQRWPVFARVATICTVFAEFRIKPGGLAREVPTSEPK